MVGVGVRVGLGVLVTVGVDVKVAVGVGVGVGGRGRVEGRAVMRAAPSSKAPMRASTPLFMRMKSAKGRS
jgi:hypothetical protein